MKQAYIETINDLRVELSNTKWYMFKKAMILQKKIEYYELLLKLLNY